MSPRELSQPHSVVYGTCWLPKPLSLSQKEMKSFETEFSWREVDSSFGSALAVNEAELRVIVV